MCVHLCRFLCMLNIRMDNSPVFVILMCTYLLVYVFVVVDSGFASQ